MIDNEGNETKTVYEAYLLEENKKLRNYILSRCCACDACMLDAINKGTIHTSYCSVHNMPAYPKGDCDCVGFDLSKMKELE